MSKLQWLLPWACSRAPQSCGAIWTRAAKSAWLMASHVDLERGNPNISDEGASRVEGREESNGSPGGGEHLFSATKAEVQ